jgi:hypothetical protein
LTEGRRHGYRIIECLFTDTQLVLENGRHSTYILIRLALSVSMDLQCRLIACRPFLLPTVADSSTVDILVQILQIAMEVRFRSGHSRLFILICTMNRPCGECHPATTEPAARSRVNHYHASKPCRASGGQHTVTRLQCRSLTGETPPRQIALRSFSAKPCSGLREACSQS